MSPLITEAPLVWSITPWQMNGKGGWKMQPVILVEGRKPFLADTPEEYIAELERLNYDRSLAQGPFHTFIGQLKDALEMAWSLPELVPSQEEAAFPLITGLNAHLRVRRPPNGKESDSPSE